MAGDEQELDTQSADERDKRKLEEAASKLEKGKEEERESEPDIEVVDGERPDEQDDDERREEPDTGPQRPSRLEKRGQRYQDLQRDLEMERARTAALEVQLSQTRQQPATPQRSVDEQRNEVVTAYRQDLAAIQRARRDLQAVVQANKDNWNDAIEARVMEEDNNLRIAESDAQRRYFTRLDQVERPAPRPAVNPAIQLTLSRYDDVVKDPVALRHADLYYLEKKRADPSMNEVELVEESMKYGRAKLRGEAFSPATRERPKPTKEQKAKYTGGGSNGAAGPPSPSARLTITKDEDKMAQKLYAHIPDQAERRRMYVKNVLNKGART